MVQNRGAWDLDPGGGVARGDSEKTLAQGRDPRCLDVMLSLPEDTFPWRGHFLPSSTQIEPSGNAGLPPPDALIFQEELEAQTAI